VQTCDNNPFDQTIEETVNKDTQTDGGTKVFSLNTAPVSKYYVTAEPDWSSYEKWLSTKSQELATLISSRMKRDETDVESVEDLLDNQWTNPFNDKPSDIVSLSTGKAAPVKVATDLLEAQEKGNRAYAAYKTERLGPNVPNPSLTQFQRWNSKHSPVLWKETSKI